MLVVDTAALFEVVADTPTSEGVRRWFLTDERAAQAASGQRCVIILP